MAAPSPRAPVAWLLLPLVAGYLAGSALPSAVWLLTVGGAALSCLALISASPQGRWSDAAWPWLAFAAATCLAGGYFQHRTASGQEWDTLPPREALLTLEVDRLFGSGTERVHGFAVVNETEAHLAELTGRKVYFSMAPSEKNDRWEKYTRLRGSGLLEVIPSDTPEADSFLNYLTRSGARFQYRRVVLKEDPLPPRGFFGFCARQRDRFETYLRRGSYAPVAMADIYVAMLLGKRSELSDEQKTAFLQSGTLHLFAISGLHIGVIAFALHTLLTLARTPAKPAALVGLSLLFCFVVITGASPSAVRAFLMVLFFWGARFFLRAPNPIAALANSALLVLLFFPNQLWSPGFQLSYSVVAGILFLGLPLGERLQAKWEPYRGLPPESLNRIQRGTSKAVRWFAMTLAISLSATLLSSPLSIHYFEIFSPGAVLFNLLLIPAASLVIVAGFISVFLNLFGLGGIGIVFNHAAWMILEAMESVVKIAPSLPSLFWQASFLSPWLGPLALVTVLTSLLICAHRQWKPPLFHFVTPFLLFVLFLSVAARLTFLAD